MVLGAISVYALIRGKQLAIFLVKLYQRFAPDALRNQCRYEPSCSTYMIRSIEKFGLARGLARGVRRIQRCRNKGGGFEDV